MLRLFTVYVICHNIIYKIKYLGAIAYSLMLSNLQLLREEQGCRLGKSESPCQL
jgi:hypothetical protein